MPDEVVIFTKPGCPYCAAAKKDLAEKGVQYEERDVASSAAVKEEAIKIGGQAAVPVIVRNGEVTVGFGGS